MEFRDFAIELGLIVTGFIPRGQWFRVPTVSHPKKKNGSVFFDGEYAHACNWEIGETQTWFAESDSKPNPELVRRISQSKAQNDLERISGYARASKLAQELIDSASLSEHPYLKSKGFGQTLGLVVEDVLLIPMRDVSTGVLLGVQRIKASDGGKFEKRMLYGMRAKGAVYRLGDPRRAETWLVEGYATGLSVDAALGQMRLSGSVLVAFSSGNLVYSAGKVGGDRYVFADNDLSGTGEAVAIKTGLPWVMSERVGEDANDLHMREGIFAVRELLGKRFLRA